MNAPSRPLIAAGLLLMLALAACSLPTPSSAPTAVPAAPTSPPTAQLVVTWVEGGNLMVWRTGDDLPRRIAAGGVIQPFLSPDGQTVAFTRGAQGHTSTLWLADVTGVAERQIAGPDSLNSVTPEGMTREIGQVMWADGNTVYFNTALVPVIPRPGGTKADDLWRVMLPGGTATPLLPDGEGGDFAIRPDGGQLALVTAGFYGQTPGAIRLANPDGLILRDLLAFDAPATASEYSLYPGVQWLADGSALLTAIPDPDLIYPASDGDAPRLVTLWRLPVEGDAIRLNDVPAAFFGLPRWSPDGAWLTYLAQTAPPEANVLDLILATGDGNNPTVIVTGGVGAISPPLWGAAGFLYTGSAPGELWLGVPDQPATRLPSPAETAYFPRWADETLLVYASTASAPYELRTYDRATGLAAVIATVNAGPPVFDAIHLP